MNYILTGLKGNKSIRKEFENENEAVQYALDNDIKFVSIEDVLNENFTYIQEK